MEKKKLDETFFTTNWSNWQTESSTDIGTDRFSSKWHTRVAQCPMMKKRFFFQKKSSQNILGHVVSSCDKLADYFLTKKKPLFLRSLSKNHRKNKQKLCQNEVMSSKWSFGLVESSVVNLAEKKFGRRLIIFGWMSKNDVKKNFWQNFCTTIWSDWQTESSTDNGTDKFLSKWQKMFAQCPMLK